MSADGGQTRREHAEEQAKAKGCVVVEPKPNELFIDIDREEDLEFFHKNIVHVAKRCSLTVEMRPSLRKGHFHVVVRFADRELMLWERIAFQAVLGSDRVRELISVFRLLDGDKAPTLFFEKPEAVRLRAMESPPPPVKKEEKL